MTSPSHSQYANAFAEKVQAHGVLGIAVWRDECLRDGLAHAAVADALVIGVAKLRGTTPEQVAALPVPVTGMRRILWARTHLTHELAAEALTIGEYFGVHPEASAAVVEDTHAGLSLLIANVAAQLSDRARGAGRPLTQIAREWPRFDPAAGYLDGYYERAIAQAWLAMPDHALDVHDVAALELALAAHQHQPAQDFVALVAIAAGDQFAGPLAEGRAPDARTNASPRVTAPAGARLASVSAPPPVARTQETSAAPTL